VGGWGGGGGRDGGNKEGGRGKQFTPGSDRLDFWQKVLPKESQTDVLLPKKKKSWHVAFAREWEK
jgi:hypothetical protein